MGGWVGGGYLNEGSSHVGECGAVWSLLGWVGLAGRGLVSKVGETCDEVEEVGVGAWLGASSSSSSSSSSLFFLEEGGLLWGW